MQLARQLREQPPSDRFGYKPHIIGGSELNSGALSKSSHWYAVRTKANQENRAAANLSAWQVQTFTPKLREESYGDRVLIKPLFSRYIFAHCDDSRVYKINGTRGVQNVVSFGGRPVPVDDEVIDLIRSRLDDDGIVQIEDFEIGDKVQVKSGNLRSLCGIFQQKLKDSDRVKILLSTVNYQSHLVIDRELIEKVA
jgi:transcriptional antiterminator RfaH